MVPGGLSRAVTPSKEQIPSHRMARALLSSLSPGEQPCCGGPRAGRERVLGSWGLPPLPLLAHDGVVGTPSPGYHVAAAMLMGREQAGKEREPSGTASGSGSLTEVATTIFLTETKYAFLGAGP